MNIEELTQLAQSLVFRAKELKDLHTIEKNAAVNYACVFAHSKEEYDSLLSVAHQRGKVVRETQTGPLFQVSPIDTVAGGLQLLKIRIPDVTRPERGDADFTIKDYQSFKSKYLSQPGFKLIERPAMEMIELMDQSFDVRAYFSFPPLDQQLGIVGR